jgi:hypothetical protein
MEPKEQSSNCWLELETAETARQCDGCDRIIPAGEEHVANRQTSSVGLCPLIGGCHRFLCADCIFCAALLLVHLITKKPIPATIAKEARDNGPDSPTTLRAGLVLGDRGDSFGLTVMRSDGKHVPYKQGGEEGA